MAKQATQRANGAHANRRHHPPVDLEHIARELGNGKARREGAGWKTLCPGHDDNEPSLSLKLSDGGQLLVKCRSRCSQPEVIAALKAWGLWPVAPASPKGSRCKAPRPKITATYDYIDKQGKLRSQVVRYDPKHFRQRRPEPSARGGWAWSTKGVPDLLYRLPEVIKAIARGDTVVIVEGEKDADNVAKLGLSATCNQGGAKNWKPTLNKYLKNADVVLIADNDDIGREHVARVARQLAPVAKSLRILDLGAAWPACPMKGDISNWLERARVDSADPLAELLMLLEDAPPFDPGAAPAADEPANDAADVSEDWSNRQLGRIARSSASCCHC